VKKKLVIAGSTLLALVALAGGLAWYYMGKPLYEPGKLASGKGLRASLTPPAQSRDGTGWVVEQGITLHHYAHGTGRGVLVVHGGPGKPIQRPWPGLEPLSGEYVFHYYDQRGCGRSTRPIDRFSSSNYYGNMQALEKTLGLGAQIADIERIRKILGEEKLVLLGHSFGAFLASLYAAEFPDRVSALVLVAPASVLVMPGEDGGFFGEVGRLLPEEMRQEYAGYLKSYLDFGNIFSRTEAELVSVNAGFDKYYRIAARAKGFSAPDEDQTNAQGGWMVQAMYFSMGKRHDYRFALKKTPAPVLVIHGENDIRPERASRAYSDAFLNSTFRLIGRAGHFPFLDQPAEFAMAVGGFLRGVK
jgi:proline iminopeptidase